MEYSNSFGLSRSDFQERLLLQECSNDLKDYGNMVLYIFERRMDMIKEYRVWDRNYVCPFHRRFIVDAKLFMVQFFEGLLLAFIILALPIIAAMFI